MFKNFLNFKNGYPGKIFISEPVGSDNQSMTIETEFFAPDLEYGNEENALILWKGFFEEYEESIQLPNGAVVVNISTMGYDWLLQYDSQYGTEAEVEMIVEQNGVEFVQGEIDFSDTFKVFPLYIECRVIMSGQRASMRDEADTKINLLADKDLKGNPITPLVPENILMKALPLSAKSEWKQTYPRFMYAGYHIYFNFAEQNAGGIADSLVPAYDVDKLFWTQETAGNKMRYIRARQDNKNVVMEVDLNYTFYYRYSGLDPDGIAGLKGKVLITPEAYEDFPSNAIYEATFYDKTIADGIDQDFDFAQTLTVPLPDVPRDYCVSVFWVLDYGDGNLGTTGDVSVWQQVLVGAGLAGAVFDVTSGATNGTAWLINNQTLRISSNAVGIDTVVKGIRKLDAERQTALIISGLPVEAPRDANGGEHYNNFYINGWGMRGFLDKPFYITWADLKKDMRETCGDAMVNRDNIFIGEYPDFHQNIDMGAFLETPSDDSFEDKDPFYTLKLFGHKYAKFENNDKDTDEYIRNTNQSIHTEQQKRFPSRRNKNQLDIELPFARDPLRGEIMKSQSQIAKPEASLSSDDEIMKYSCVPLASNSKGKFGKKLFVRVNGEGTITVLNQAEQGEPDFGWTVLGGFKVGDIITITDAINSFSVHGLIGDWSVVSVEFATLTLAPVTVVSVLDNDVYINFEFYYTDVYYTIRTSEDVTFENITNGDLFGNKDYAPRQNLIKWESFLHAAAINSETKTIETSYYKNNGEARTKRTGQARFYQENEPLVVAELTPPIVDGRLTHSKFQVGFSRMIALYNNIAVKRGFIRTIHPISRKVVRVHFKKLKYGWFSELLEGIFLKRANQDKIIIDKVGTGIEINGAPYERGDLAKNHWFEINQGLVALFDGNQLELFTATPFAEVVVNGITYTDENLFMDALLNLF